MARPLNAQGDVWMPMPAQGSVGLVARPAIPDALLRWSGNSVEYNLTGYIRYVIDQERPA